jgi:hypothetical protein
MIKRRNQFARGQIAARAENDDGVRLGQFARHSDRANRPGGRIRIFHAPTMTQRTKNFNARIRELRSFKKFSRGQNSKLET